MGKTTENDILKILAELEELEDYPDEEEDESVSRQERYYYFKDRPLNQEQRQVVDDIQKRVITVSAGPGSGKTTALVNRMVKLIEKDNVDPKDIVLLTFTNKAKDEMKKRFLKMMRDKALARQVIFSTFHSYAAHLINAVPTLEERLFDDARDTLSDPAKREKVVEKYAKKKYLMLDEAQDMKEAYYDLVCGMMKYNYTEKDGTYLQVTAVFDIDQAIFGYDGADDGLVGKLRHIKKDGQYSVRECEDAVSACFKINYRSTEEIVDFTEKYREHYFKENNIPIERKLDDKMKSGFQDIQYSRKGEIQLVNCGARDRFKDVLTDKVYDDIVEHRDRMPEDEETTVGILVPTNEDVRYIYAKLKDAFQNDVDVAVQFTAAYGRDDGESDGDINFPLDCLDEFHALLKRLHERKDRKGKITKESFEEALEDFCQKYQDSKYKEGVCRFARELINDQIVYEEDIDYKEFRLDLRAAKFEEFYLDYIVNAGQKAKVTITVSTIHKAKGREFSWVYMSKMQNSITPELIKNRFVAITRAQFRLVIVDDDPWGNYMGYEEQKTEPVYELKHQDKLTRAEGTLVCDPYTLKDVMLSFMPTKRNFQTFLQAGSYAEEDAEKENFFEDTPVEYQAGTGKKLCEQVLNDRIYFWMPFGGYQESSKRNAQNVSIEKAEVNVVVVYRNININYKETGVGKPSGKYEDSFLNQYPEMEGDDGRCVKRKVILPIVWYRVRS